MSLPVTVPITGSVLPVPGIAIMSFFQRVIMITCNHFLLLFKKVFMSNVLSLCSLL